MSNGISVFAETAWLASGWAKDVKISIDAAGTITRVDTDTAFEAEYMTRVPGPLLPGMPNLHSHAHQRAMAGMSEFRASGAGANDSFWTWREVMHRFAEQVTPELLESVAAQLYVEMVKAGYTAVCEFHYMHHGSGGVPYADPAEMSMALMRAAARAGIGITLLPVLYVNGGYGGAAPNAGQARFISTPDQLLTIINAVEAVHNGDPQTCVGVAPHSPRHVDADALRDILQGIGPNAPVHIHVAEQTRDVEESVKHTGLRPVEWLFDHADIGPRWCLVHATHLTDAERAQMAVSGAVAGLCPTTEANLGDGLFPLIPYLADSGVFGIGSDSHISVNMIEELRLLEYGQRLTQRHRNLAAGSPGASTGVQLYQGALKGGAQATGRPVGEIAVGKRADFVALDPGHPALVGKAGDRLIDSLVFATNTPPFLEVWIGGKRQVVGGRHVREQDTLDAFSQVMRALDF